MDDAKYSRVFRGRPRQSIVAPKNFVNVQEEQAKEFPTGWEGAGGTPIHNLRQLVE
jgi:hypothetical protein